MIILLSSHAIFIHHFSLRKISYNLIRRALLELIILIWLYLVPVLFWTVYLLQNSISLIVCHYLATCITSNTWIVVWIVKMQFLFNFIVLSIILLLNYVWRIIILAVITKFRGWWDWLREWFLRKISLKLLLELLVSG